MPAAQPDINLLKAIDAAITAPSISGCLSRNLPTLKIASADVIFAPSSNRVLLLRSRANEVDARREIGFAELICKAENVHFLLTGKAEAIDGIAIERRTFVQLKDRTDADYNASRATPVDEFIRVWGKTLNWSGIELYVRTKAPVADIRLRWFMRGVQPEIKPDKHLITNNIGRVIAYGADGHAELPCRRNNWIAAGGPTQ